MVNRVRASNKALQMNGIFDLKVGASTDNTLGKCYGLYQINGTSRKLLSKSACVGGLINQLYFHLNGNMILSRKVFVAYTQLIALDSEMQSINKLLKSIRMELINSYKRTILEGYGAGDFNTIAPYISNQAKSILNQLCNRISDSDRYDIELSFLKIAARDLVRDGYEIFNVGQWKDHPGGTMKYCFYTANRLNTISAIQEGIKDMQYDEHIAHAQMEKDIENIFSYRLGGDKHLEIY